MIPSFDPAKTAASAGASVGASLGARVGPVGAGVGAGFGAASGYIAGALVAPIPGRKVLPDGGEIEAESESSEQSDGVVIPVTEA
ncbi:MAG: hypothetical protein U5K28_12175 [Halobacteriales archaeon]|nr:hypothetical protein [Halobacteriales archaeon]